MLWSLIISTFFLVGAIELDISNGRILGKTVRWKHQKLHAFKKVPFAQPPVGNLRFRKPQPALKWSGTLNSTEYGPSCMINITRSDHPVNQSEDCLYINVFTSNNCLVNKKCPVFIMVHGGSFIFGNSVQYNDSQILDKFVSHDIVFVLPAYRVGFFGFIDLGHDYEDGPYNVGLYDLIANLEWIQKEIDKFGGDPKRVTFMGYSSGATAIQYILSSPKLQNRRLFDRVLLSSGNPIMAPGLSWNISHMLLNITNCSRSSNWTLSIREKLKCLRSLSAEELNVKTGELKEYWEHLKPQSSKSLLPARSYGELAKKRKPIPIMVMTSVLEMGTLFTAKNEDNAKDVCEKNLRIFGYVEEETIRICAYRYKDMNDTYPLARDIYHASAIFECRVNSGRGRQRKNESDGNIENPCYLGIFAQKNHSRHVDEMYYLIGQHLINYANFTTNDFLMDKFYPNAVRNFIRGQAPADDWTPTNEKGQNYYWLSFDVLAKNKSERQWPRMIEGTYDRENTEFFLDYLSVVENNASQFNQKRDVFNLIENLTSSDEIIESGYQRVQALTSIWTVVLIAIFILFIGLIYQMKGRRRDIVNSSEPLQPISSEKKVFSYHAI